MANEEVAGIRVVKVLATGIAAASANFFWYSGYVPVSSGPAITLNSTTIILLLAFGIALALPLDRLLRNYWTACALDQVVEMAAILAVTTAMITHPGSGTLSIDSFSDSAVRAVHVFIVLLVAIFANSKIN